MPSRKSSKKNARTANRKGAARVALGARRRAKAVVNRASRDGRAAASSITKKVKKAASNPRRTIRQAAENVHITAGRAREFGESVVTAGQVLQETADFVDSMARRAKSRAGQRRQRTVRPS